MARSVFRVNSLISVSLPELKGVRDAKGRFTKAQSAMRDRNAEYARSLQADVVQLIEARITRPGASTNRLVNVTGAPENAQYDTWSAGVGVKKFLDTSVAKYWRTFEEGSAAVWAHPFTGTQLFPVGRPPFPVAHGMKPGLRATAAGSRYQVSTGKLLPWMDGSRFVVKHEIAPRHAYRDAVAGAGAPQFLEQNARRLIDDILGR